MAHSGVGTEEKGGATRVSIQLLLDTTQQLVLKDSASLGSDLGVQANPFEGHGGKRGQTQSGACPRSHSREVPDLAISNGCCSLAAPCCRLGRRNLQRKGHGKSSSGSLGPASFPSSHFFIRCCHPVEASHQLHGSHEVSV